MRIVENGDGERIAVGVDRDAEPGERRRVEAAEAAARTDDAPAPPGAFEHLHGDRPAVARRRVEATTSSGKFVLYKE
jgi:hypothetical protein